MSESKSVVKQVEELQVIVHELDEENLGLKKGFMVGSIIEKLPSNWKNFKIYLKHITEDMSMDQLILKLCVEEDHHENEKYDVSSLEAKANVVEGGDSHKARHYQKNKGKDAAKKALTAAKGKTFKKALTAAKGKTLDAKANVVEGGDSHKARHYQKNKGKDAAKKALTAAKGKTFKKIKRGCWVCGKTCHKAKDCRHKKDQNSENSNQANIAEDKFVAVVSEVNLLTNSNDW